MTTVHLDDHHVYTQNRETGQWEKAIPSPYYHGIFRWLWLRLTGYRDAYGRKAQVFLPWQ